MMLTEGGAADSAIFLLWCSLQKTTAGGISLVEPTMLLLYFCVLTTVFFIFGFLLSLKLVGFDLATTKHCQLMASK